jgi:hypothetical protein
MRVDAQIRIDDFPLMPDDSLGAALSARFRDDAQALRARASVLDAQRGATRGHGPSAAACRQMADACDRVHALLAAATDGAALAAAAPELERLRAAEQSPDAKHVYAGAVQRVRQALGDGADDDLDDDEDEEDEDEDDDD